MWKGNKAKYRAIHAWIRSNYGKADKCEGKTCKGICKNYQWANLSGKYRRDIKDYIMLCRSCHIQFDNMPKKISKTLTGRKMPEETKRKISLANKGKVKKCP